MAGQNLAHAALSRWAMCGNVAAKAKPGDACLTFGGQSHYTMWNDLVWWL